MPSHIDSQVLYHGTRRPFTSPFDISRSDKNNPFGPAIYLTENIDVARCYAKHGGVIYEVMLECDSAEKINLDEFWHQQTRTAKRSMLALHLYWLATKSPVGAVRLFAKCIDVLGWVRRSEATKSIILLMLFRITRTYISMDNAKARDIIDQPIEGCSGRFTKTLRNEILRSFGIRMLYGELSGNEMSGRCDHGVQFAVIDGSVIAGRKTYHLKSLSDFIYPEPIFSC